MDYEREIKELLKAHGGELDRANKHKVYRLGNGKRFIIPQSPKRCSAENAYIELCKLVGVTPVRQGSGRPSRKRRERFRARINFEFIEPRGKTFAEKLQEAIGR